MRILIYFGSWEIKDYVWRGSVHWIFFLEDSLFEFGSNRGIICSLSDLNWVQKSDRRVAGFCMDWLLIGS